MKFSVRAACAVLGLLSLPVLVGFSSDTAAQGQGGERPPTAVTVVTVEAEDIILTTRLPGRVVASEMAEVRPQVVGIIDDRLFDEGAFVEAGTPLYRIDPASYEAAAAQAEAQVMSAKAELRRNETAAERMRQDVARNRASRSELEEMIAARDAARAAVATAEAQGQMAQIDLDRTTLRAPISGVIGRSLVSRGSLVTAGQASALAVIRSLDPVYVDVTQSAAELVRFRRQQAAGRGADVSGTVTLFLADGSEYPVKGSLTAADPNVDERSGAVTLRMTFPNPDALLLPGMYVQAEVPQGTESGVFLVPQEGVARNRRGEPTALIVNADDVVERRDLKTLGSRGSNWIVSEGLEDGDRVIVAGLQKVSADAKVRPEERPAPAAAETQGTATSSTN